MTGKKLTAMEQAQLDIVSQKVFERTCEEIRQNLLTAEKMVQAAKAKGGSMEGMYLGAVAILMLGNSGISARAVEDLKRFGGMN